MKSIQTLKTNISVTSDRILIKLCSLDSPRQDQGCLPQLFCRDAIVAALRHVVATTCRMLRHMTSVATIDAIILPAAAIERNYLLM